jgi:hypothetical protein
MRTYDLLLTPTIAVAPFKQGIQGPETIEGKGCDYSIPMTGATSVVEIELVKAD